MSTTLKPLKFGVFGTGLMAGIYTDILQQRPDCQVLAVVGNTEAKTAQFAAKFGLKGYANSQFDRMLADHADLDAVVVATPEWVRAAPIKAVIDKKKHILLEKPFAPTWKEACKLKEMLEGYSRVFQVCHVLRYSPRFCALAEAVKRGEVGELRQIFARRNSNHDRVLRVLGKTDLAYWLTPHDLDIMNWITGSPVERVFAVSRGGLKTADDYLIANLRFGNGVDAVLENSWSNPPLSGQAREAFFEVRGRAGVADLDDAAMNVRVFKKDSAVLMPDTYEDYLIHGMRRGFFENLISHFVDRVKKRDVSDLALRDAVETARVCGMIRESLDQGRIVIRSEEEFKE